MKAAGSVDKQLTKNKLMKTVLDGMIAEKLQFQEAKKQVMKIALFRLNEILEKN